MDFEGRRYHRGGPCRIIATSLILLIVVLVRGPRVQNDRAGEGGRTLKCKDFDHRFFERRSATCASFRLDCGIIARYR